MNAALSPYYFQCLFTRLVKQPVDEDVPLIADSIVLEISRKTLNTPELYIGLSGQVSISQQTPVGETTGIGVPGLG